MNTSAENQIVVDNAAEFLAFFDDDINEGRYTLHPWQVEILLAATGEDYTAEDPFKACVKAVNGSGKDRMIIASLAVFFLCCHKKSTVVITSGSAKQLDNQTKPALRHIAGNVNAKMGAGYIELYDRKIYCPSTGSYCYMFATDQGEKAEGYHPIDPGCKMLLIVNEAKSVDEEIFKALYRCTGFTHRIDISSPGLARGHFYNVYTSERWRNWEVTAFDCPHLGNKFAEDIAAEYGENSALYASMVLCQFGNEDARVVIPLDNLNRCTQNSREWKSGEVVAGFDPSKGGDESVLAIRNGNKLLELLTIRTTNTSVLISTVMGWLHKYKVSKLIGDAGGLGAPILDEIKRRGFDRIVYVINNNTPNDQRAYYNRGTELWFNLAHLIDDCIPIFPKDAKLSQQLSERKYVNVDGERMKLEDKKKLSKSPDRADAVVLAFADYSHKKYGTTFQRKLNEEPVKEKIPNLLQMVRKKHDRFKSAKKPVGLLEQEIKEINESIKRHQKDVVVTES